MQLIVILLATVSVLTFLSGFIVFFGSTKKDRARSLWFFLAAIFATVWMTAISFFLVADEAHAESIDWHIAWTFISAILLDVAFLGYAGWQKKYGRIVTMVFLVLGVLLSATILINPQEFYSNVVLSNAGNSMTMVSGPLYFAYNGFFGVIIPAIIVTYLQQFLSSSSKRRRGGDIVTMVSYGISSIVILVCNLILPLLGNWGTIWLGPLSLALTIISVYYTILRYQVISFVSLWLRIFSYVVILASVAIVYMIIFSLIFAALFRGAAPSIEVIVLNFIMILIFLTLTPAINSLISSVNILSKNHGKVDNKENK